MFFLETLTIVNGFLPLLLVGRVLGLCAGTRRGVGFRGEGGGTTAVLRTRTDAGDDESFCTTPFFLAEKRNISLISCLIAIAHFMHH